MDKKIKFHIVIVITILGLLSISYFNYSNIKSIENNEKYILEKSSFDNYEISETENTSFEETTTEISTENFKKTDLEVSFIDVGQADACLLESEGHFMMIDAGNNDDSALILNYLNSKNVKTIDYMIGTHPHEDHIGSMDTVINNFDVDTVYLPKVIHNTKTFEDVLTAIENKNLRVLSK